MSFLHACRRLVLGLLAAGVGLTAQAAPYSAWLTFDFAPCHACYNLRQIGQDYGDVSGLVDVAYLDVLHPGESLRMWDSGYNDLHNVAYARGGNQVGQSHGRIELRAAGERTVRLDAMDFGAWLNTTRNTHIRVGALGSAAALFAYDGAVGDGVADHTRFLFDDLTAAGGLWIDWFDTATDVGIDNLRFTVADVASPLAEPGSLLLLFGGVVLLAACRKRHLFPAAWPMRSNP